MPGGSGARGGLVPGGVCARGRSGPGGVSGPGVSGPGGVSGARGRSGPWGISKTTNTPQDQTPPINRITDRCKNITFANYVCGR